MLDQLCGDTLTANLATKLKLDKLWQLLPIKNVIKASLACIYAYFDCHKHYLVNLFILKVQLKLKILNKKL